MRRPASSGILANLAAVHFWRSIGFASILPAACVAAIIVIARPSTLLAVTGLGDLRGSEEAAITPAVGETYRWRPVAIGGGGFITGYSADLSGATRVARTDVYGAYLWRPERNRWTQLVTSASMPAADRVQAGMNEGVYEIAVAPSDPDRVYMAIKGRVYRSADRGAHWTRSKIAGDHPLTFDPNSEFRNYGPFLAVSPRDPDLVLLGTPGDGVWRSADGGLNWEKIDSIPPNADLRPASGQQSPGAVIWFEKARNGDSTGRIWVMVAGKGMFASQGDGKTFAPLPSSGSGAGPLTIKRGDFAPDGSFYGVDDEEKRVWVYRRGAWDDITERSGLPRRAYAAIAIDPRNGDLFLFDEGGQTFRSTDNGANWWRLPHRVAVGEGDPPWLRVNDQSYFATGSVQFDPVVPGRLWLCAGSGVYFADVSSPMLWITWTSQTRGIEELVANDVVQPPGGPPLFAAWDFGIHVKDDLDAFSTTYGPKERVLIAAQQLDWSASDPGFIVTNASDTRKCCAGDGDSVLAGYSFDGGRDWSKFATLPRPPGTLADDPWRMSYGTIAVSAGDTSNIVWEPSFNRSPFYTKDRGAHWTRVALPGERLPDTGSHPDFWVQRKTLAADRVRGGVFYLVHSGGGENDALKGLWRTSDGGANWERVFAGEIAPESGFAAKLRAVPGHPGHLFFTSGVADGPDTRLRRSTDGGGAWSVVPNVTHVDDIAFGKTGDGAAYPPLFISGRVANEYGIWRSLDNAEHWRKIAEFPLGTLDQVTVIEAAKDGSGRVYLGYEGSGWIYGEPAQCAPNDGQPQDPGQCVAVR
jgi:photosystem II stability/assembly factor-like uncharacterized protein